jgi:AraC family transcriptional regulator
LNRGRRVIDIALDYGFGSERAFSRAFKNEYSVSPGRYRELIESRTAPVKLDLAVFQQNNIFGGVVMEPKIIRKPAFKVAGFELKTTTLNGENKKTCPAFWDKYNKENRREKLLADIKPAGQAELGLCFPGIIESEAFSYVIGMEVSDFKGVPADYFKGEVPAATWAVFTTPPANQANAEFVKAIQGTWEYIYKSWFPKSGYEFDGQVKVDFELYDERSMGEIGVQMDIYLPVVKRK